MKKSWFVIANPASGNKKLSKKQKEIEQLLQTHHIDFSIAFTDFSKHEIELVHEAIQQGYRKIISVGGDGTLHNVVNGVMMQSYTKTSDITIAVIPLGTGNDWIKTYNIPNDIEKSIEIIANEKTFAQDIGFLKLENTSVYFNNVAGIGFDGYVVKKLNNSKQLGAFAYLTSGILGLLNYKATNFNIQTDSESFQVKSLLTLIAIGKYCGGGMQLTDYKNTKPNEFAITIAKNITFFDLISLIKKLFNGQIFSHKKVQTCNTKTITIIPPKDKTIYIQADGELIGSGKVTAKIIEKAINFVIA